MNFYGDKMTLSSVKLDHNKLLTSSEWLIIKKILRQLGFKVHLEEINQKNQKILWYTLQFCQQEKNKKIKQLIFQLHNLCSQLDKKNKSKHLLSPLLKIKSVFCTENYYHSLTPYQGLKSFLRKINTTTGSPANFLQKLKTYQDIRYFLNNNGNKMLINEYTYLKNITLPLSGYEKLRKSLLKLLEKFKYFDKYIFNRKKAQTFLTSLQKFKNIYILHYCREHKKYQKKLDQFYHNLSARPEYKYLQKNIFPARDNKILTSLNNFFPDHCQRENINNLLKQQPHCKCGFTLKNNQQLPEIEKVVPLLKKEIMNRNRKDDKFEKID